MPVVGFSDRIPGPVGRLEILEDDASVFLSLCRIAPDVEISPTASWGSVTRSLEPGMLVGGVIKNHLGDDADAPAVSLPQESLEVAHCAVGRVDVVVVRDVVAVVAPGRGKTGKQPDGGDANVLQIIESLCQAAEIAHAVVVAVGKRTGVDLVDDRVLVPQWIGFQIWGGIVGCHFYEATPEMWLLRRRSDSSTIVKHKEARRFHGPPPEERRPINCKVTGAKIYSLLCR